jgi:hypothetical protein
MQLNNIIHSNTSNQRYLLHKPQLWTDKQAFKYTQQGQQQCESAMGASKQASNCSNKRCKDACRFFNLHMTTLEHQQLQGHWKQTQKMTCHQRARRGGQFPKENGRPTFFVDWYAHFNGFAVERACINSASCQWQRMVVARKIEKAMRVCSRVANRAVTNE